LQVFVDGRCELYGPDFLLSYDRAEQKAPALIEAWYRQYGFGHALVQTGSLFDRYLESAASWSLVRRTATATLYRRKAQAKAGT